MERGGAVYIMTNKTGSTLYVGVTSDLYKRVAEHKSNTYPRSFTARYRLHRLVYYETFHSIEEAIAREKQLKSGNRQRKMDFINAMNPNWSDLFEKIKEW